MCLIISLSLKSSLIFCPQNYLFSREGEIHLHWGLNDEGGNGVIERTLWAQTALASKSTYNHFSGYVILMNTFYLRMLRVWCRLEHIQFGGPFIKKYKATYINLGKKENIYNYTLKTTNTTKFRKKMNYSPTLFIHEKLIFTTTAIKSYQMASGLGIQWSILVLIFWRCGGNFDFMSSLWVIFFLTKLDVRKKAKVWGEGVRHHLSKSPL